MIVYFYKLIKDFSFFLSWVYFFKTIALVN